MICTCNSNDLQILGLKIGPFLSSFYPLGVLLGRPWVPLEGLGAALGAQGRSRDSLGGHLAALGALWGCTGELLGPFLGHKLPHIAAYGRIWPLYGRIWTAKEAKRKLKGS